MIARKLLPSIVVGAALLAAVLTAGASPLRAEEKLAAPIYPGAIRLSPAAVRNMAPIEFAVKDAHDKVAAFYAPKFGRPAKEGEAEQIAANLTSIVVVDPYQVLNIIQAAKGDITLQRAALVSIEWMPELLAPMNSVNTIFRELEEQAKKFKTHQAELPELKKKYDFLQSAYYLTGKEQEVLAKYGRESGNMTQTTSDPKLMKAYSDELNKLTKEGRYTEVAALAKKYFGDEADANKRQKADNFGLWVKALDDLAAVSYQTKLSIDVHPSQWNVSWDKKR